MCCCQEFSAQLRGCTFSISLRVYQVTCLQLENSQGKAEDSAQELCREDETGRFPGEYGFPQSLQQGSNSLRVFYHPDMTLKLCQTSLSLERKIKCLVSAISLDIRGKSQMTLLITSLKTPAGLQTVLLIIKVIKNSQFLRGNVKTKPQKNESGQACPIPRSTLFTFCAGN